MKSHYLARCAIVLLGFASGAQAHHSAAQFDFTREVAITGVVKQFRAINPHMQLTLSVTDASGTRDVEFEGHSTNNMYRSGYRKGMIAAGDKITVNVAPPRAGGDGGYVTSAVTAKGEFFGMHSTRLADPAKAQATAEGR